MVHENKRWDFGEMDKIKLVISVDESAVDLDKGSSKRVGASSNETKESSESMEDDFCLNPCEAGDSSRQRVAPTDGSPLRKTRSLTEVYNSCTFALNIADPSCYSEAVKNKE